MIEFFLETTCPQIGNVFIGQLQFSQVVFSIFQVGKKLCVIAMGVLSHVLEMHL